MSVKQTRRLYCILGMLDSCAYELQELDEAIRDSMSEKRVSSVLDSIEDAKWAIQECLTDDLALELDDPSKHVSVKIGDLLKTALSLTDEEQAIVDEHITSPDMTMLELVSSLRKSPLSCAHCIASKIEGFASDDDDDDCYVGFIPANYDDVDAMAEGRASVDGKKGE